MHCNILTVKNYYFPRKSETLFNFPEFTYSVQIQLDQKLNFQHWSVCRNCDFITITSSARILPILYVTLFLTSYLLKNVKKTFISLSIIMIQLSSETTLINGKPFLAIFFLNRNCIKLFHCKSRHFTLLLDIFLEHCKVLLTSIHLLNYYDLTDW